ncbi:DUF397 domain-containing protein [Actinophytocola sp.]|uniref:DUF397 domain-containing protein n=1 Tax=Actinophytocola sp. TaxID=1872138 RepID=UPI003899DDA3
MAHRAGAGIPCVEVAFVGAAVGVRDSRHGGGTHLDFGDVAWRTFATGVKGGLV